jgi:hypothetical protein
MSIDDLLIAIIIVGVGVSCAYLRAELLLHRRTTALKRATELVRHELHSETAPLERNEISMQPVPALTVFQLMRDLARVLRISVEDRNFRFVRERARRGAGYGL